MKHAPSIYAHLPTKEKDYEYILNRIYDDMKTKDLDIMISSLRGNKVRYHYRTSLVNLGLLSYSKDKSSIILNEAVLEYKQGQINLKKTLKKIVENNSDIMYIKQIVIKKGIIDFQSNKVYEIINQEFPNRGIDSIKRWMRPVVFLIRYVYCDGLNEVELINYPILLEKIQEEYFKHAVDYGDPVAIEKIDCKIKVEFPQINTIELWEQIFIDSNLKYRLSFITLPNWASSSNSISIQNNAFTHIRIKKDLCEVKRNE